MAWLDELKGDSRPWLLEPDPANPAIRCFALRDLQNRSPDDPEVAEARAAIMTSGPVPRILDAQHPKGYWQQPGGGYTKYQGTVWQIMILNELGADPADERVRRGCEYVLSHSVAEGSGFSTSKKPVPGSVLHCLNGNLLHALTGLGYLDDPRIQQALEWQVNAITGEEPIQYFQSATSGPEFACAINGHLPCGWGATKALKGLIAVPLEQRTPAIKRALDRGAKFLLSYDLAKAEYPHEGKISPHWFKLGFPLSYWSDVLETLDMLVALGYGPDPRLTEAFRWLLNKQDSEGRWKLQNSLGSKMWAPIEQKGKPSKWITLRAWRVLKVSQFHIT